MKNKAWISMLAAALTVGASIAAGTHKAPTYILNGYGFGRLPGVNTAELEAKLKHKAGERVTEADMNVDQAIVQKEVDAHHLKGVIVATFAEKKGRVWVIF